MAKFNFDIIGIKRHRNHIFTVVIILICFIIIYNAALQRKLNALQSSRSATDVSRYSKLNPAVRILCLIITTPKHHDNRAVHVKRTWGQHCNRLLFMSTEEHADLESVALNAKDEHQHRWGKIKEAFKYVLSYHSHEADWFLKADDDTFVVLNNLRYFLQAQNPQQPIYFGRKQKAFVEQGYMSDGPGYVLSKEALHRFVHRALPNSSICDQNSEGQPDIEMGKCLQGVGVMAGNTRDATGAETFIDNWNVADLYMNTKNSSIKNTKHAISFHQVEWKNMYTLEYLINKLRLFGIST